MPTLGELATELGLSRDGLKRRLGLLRSHGVNGFARGGAHGALVLTDETADLLRRIVALERSAGLPMRRAVLEALGERAAVRSPVPEASSPSSAPGERPPLRMAHAPYLVALWTLVAILGVGVAGFLALAWYLALTR